MSEYHDEDGNFDEYVEYREVSWFTRINESIKTIGTGFLLIICCFGLLIWNEGQAIVNQVAQEAIPISSDVANNQHIGQLVMTSGVITSNQSLGDNLFIQPGKYIAIARGVDMYSWVEEQAKDAKTKVGGSQTQKITTTYQKVWLPLDELNRNLLVEGSTNVISRSTKSTSFVHRTNHQNPSPTINNLAEKVKEAKIGIFDLDMSSFSLPNSIAEAYGNGTVLTGYIELPTPTPLQLSQQNLIPKAGVTNVDNYLYQGSGTLASPNIGDLRMRYAVFNANTNVTVIGKLSENNQIVPYVHKNNHRLYRLFLGSQSQALDRVKREDHVFTWGLRFLSLIFIWSGLRLIAEPINVILDFIPIFGSIGRLTTGFSTLIVALMVTISTIVIYHLTQNLVYLAIAVFITFFLANKVFSRRYRT
ncbi:MAG TPA: TMEM43 family protein [Nodularia sp. (in: cyanobacteria)]|nr:TMEM43 family protein [Nodularia sp. (in: cyanobacteria)]